MNCSEQFHRSRAWLALLPLLGPGVVLADIPINAASVRTVEDRTRIVLESSAELRFTLMILRYPNRVVLELEDAALNPVLAGLANQIAVDHPYISPVRIRPSASRPGALQLEFGLKAEAEPGIRTLKPQAGQGYRLVLDIMAPVGMAVVQPAPRTSQQIAAVTPTAPTPAPTLTPAPPPAPIPAPAPAPAPLAAVGPALSARDSSPLASMDNANLVLLEVRLDDQRLAEAISSYQFGRETFLPLGELAKLLTLAIRTQPEQGTAEGFVLAEARNFSLNVPQARLSLADQTQAFDPALVRMRSDDIYVESKLLSRWLPLDFQVDLSSLTLRVRARERLPLQERLERERLGAKAGARTGYQDPGYPREDLPYRLLGVPFIDQTLGVGVTTGNGSRQNSANYTAYLTGDLLGLETALFVSSTKKKPSPDLRFTMGRHDPDAGLLGPLRARSVMFGRGVSVPSVANIGTSSPAGQGYGLMLSNRPITQPLSFDRHTLRGDLPPGWDVELYFNDGLAGFQTSRPDGLYSFDDLPLIFGPNEFRLVFRGPLGQQRVERQTFLLDQSTTPPGEFYYNLTQHQDGAGQSRSLAQFEWGINKSLTATGGLVRVPGQQPGQPGLTGPVALPSPDAQLYANLGLRLFWGSFIAGSEFLRSPNGGWLNESNLKTRIGGTAVSYSHTQLNNFTSELFPLSSDPLRMRDKLRLDAAIASVGFLPRLPVTLELQREQAQSGRTNMAATGRVTAYVNRTLVANQLTWQSSGGTSSASGVLNLSRRLGDIGLSGQLGYSLKPEARLDTVAVAADKRLGQNYLLNLGLTRAIGSGETIYTGSLNKGLGNYGLGLTATYSSRGILAVGVQLFVAMGREPREGQWRFDALPRADSGAASLRVFLDNNANGVMDPGEEPVENVAFTVNGNRTPARSNAAGVAWLDRLPIRQGVDIAVDAQTLEDPYWASQRKGVRVVPRPGRVAELDFPVVLTSEIDGTVYLVDKSSRRGIGDVLVELLDSHGKVVSSIKSSSDGYYIVPAVVQGRYQLRVSPEQLKQFDLIDPGEREITIGSDAKFVNGVDFLLNKKQGGTEITAPR